MVKRKHISQKRVLLLQRLEARNLLACDPCTANLAPANTVPDSQETEVNTPLAFTTYRGNAISVADPDAGNLELEVTLSADHGRVTLVNRNLVDTGLTYLAGDGLEDDRITVRSKLTEINTALSWVAFTPDTNYVGSDAQLTIISNDLGNTGLGGALLDTDTISINVTPQQDPFVASPTWQTFPGALDNTFDGDGRQVLSLGSISSGVDYIDQMVLLDDGKIVAAGAVDGRLALMRFTADLQLDQTFGSGGWVNTNVNLYSYHPGVMLEVDNDGRLLVGGYGSLYRYLPNGARDTSFGSSSGYASVGTRVYDVAVHGDGRIVVASSGGTSGQKTQPTRQLLVFLFFGRFEL